jgi:hypothetical protein
MYVRKGDLVRRRCRPDDFTQGRFERHLGRARRAAASMPGGAELRLQIRRVVERAEGTPRSNRTEADALADAAALPQFRQPIEPFGGGAHAGLDGQVARDGRDGLTQGGEFHHLLLGEVQ